MSDSKQELYDILSSENKNDFQHAYMYLKYVEHFFYHLRQEVGLSVNKPSRDIDESLVDMIQKAIQQIRDSVADSDTSTYHGKIVKLKDAIQLLTQQSDLELHPNEKIIPYKIAKDVLLTNPDSISVGKCVCRMHSEKPCLPMDVCLVVGDPFASFVNDHNNDFKKITQEEAVKILEAEHERGHIHCAYFRKEMGNRFFAICNCCKCCCTSVQMWNLYEGGVPLMAPSGYIAEVNDNCDGCGECSESCPFNAISIDQEGNNAVVDFEKCMGCGVCEDKCASSAISLRKEPAKGEPLDLEELKNQSI